MLQSYRTGSSPLYEWAGIVQQVSIKTLRNYGGFPDSDIQNLVRYCFPTVELISGPLSYVFRMKVSTGTFYNVFCLLDQTSFQFRELETSQQCCICLMTVYYDFSLFEEILKAIRSLSLRNLAMMDNFLEIVKKDPKEISGFTPTMKRSVYLTEVSQVCLNLLPISGIGRIIMGLLTDTPIIVVSSDIGKESTFCYSILSLIQPMEWSHLFLPIVPSSYLETLQSPSPFIAGLHTSQLSEVTDWDIEDHMLIDLDTQVIRSPQIPDYVQKTIEKLKSPSDLKSCIVETICRVLKVPVGCSSRVTINRLKNALETAKIDAKSWEGTLIYSRTLKHLWNAIKEENVLVEYSRLLTVGSTTVTSAALQDLQSFPIISPTGKS